MSLLRKVITIFRVSHTSRGDAAAAAEEEQEPGLDSIELGVGTGVGYVDDCDEGRELETCMRAFDASIWGKEYIEKEDAQLLILRMVIASSGTKLFANAVAIH